MKTKIKDGLLLIEYEGNWYFNKDGYWQQWFDFSDINWNLTGKTTKIKIPVGEVSPKKAKKFIIPLKKNSNNDLWFYDGETLQAKITQFVREERLEELGI